MTTVGIIGLGYVGLPLAVAFAQRGLRGDRASTSTRARSRRSRRASPTSRTSPTRSCAAVAERIHADHALRASWREADAVLICVPTPLTRNREPDLGPLIDADARAREVLQARPAGGARVDHLPGHDARAVAPLLEESGLAAGPRLPPRLLARARRPRAHRLHAAQHAEGARRADRRRAPSAREELYGLVCDERRARLHARRRPS